MKIGQEFELVKVKGKKVVLDASEFVMVEEFLVITLEKYWRKRNIVQGRRPLHGRKGR